MLGYTLDILEGKNISAIMTEPGLLGECGYDDVWRLGLGCQGIETELIPLQGKNISVLLSAQLLSDQDDVTGMLATFTDITALKETTTALEKYAADLKAQNAELDAFAHTVAHDLKNPLTALMGFSSILTQRRRDLPEEVIDHHLEFISHSAQTMNNIVRELLLLASVREKEDIPREELKMDEIVKNVLHRLEYSINEFGAVIDIPDRWPTAVGYSPWVEEVWVNYISNGIKYGGRIEESIVPHLTLGADKKGNKPGSRLTMVRFWIKDNGPGLSEKEMAELFTPFERLHNVHTEGHGLGLSIVQRIVEKLGGGVSVESEIGVGSTFYFTLPAQ
jgi:PAS domain S-box-containing protein